jgi:hypothetical protein
MKTIPPKIKYYEVEDPQSHITMYWAIAKDENQVSNLAKENNYDISTLKIKAVDNKEYPNGNDGEYGPKIERML